MKMTLIACAVAGLVVLTGCESATDSKSDNGGGAITSTVYSISGSATSNLEAKVAVPVPTGLPEGVTAQTATLTYAVDQVYLDSTPGNPGWGNNGTWVANFSANPAQAKTWLVEESSSTLGANEAISLAFWMNHGHVYLKQLDVDYSDGSSQTLTFTATAGKPIHSVYTPASGTSTTEELTFPWTYFDEGLGAVTEVTTVDF